MKKYLMTGVAALAMCVAFSSCSNHDGFTGDPNVAKARGEFQKSFVAQYGQPAANQDWGFGAVSGTRYFNANANEWARNYYVPEVLTDKQIEVVTNWFTANQNPEGVAIDYAQYFVQQVSCTERGLDNMDYLYSTHNDGDHFNNYNAGQGSVYSNVLNNWLKPGTEGEDINNRYDYHSDRISFMLESGTEGFGYHNSYDSQNYNESFVIIPGYVIDPSGKYNISDRYFVGFDYSHDKTAMGEDDVVLADGYYNDWIVAIKPGLLKGKVRIIAEDLGSTEGTDIDYNDVVFDAEITEGGARIVLLAAGGTLPLYIGGQEVHNAFGVGQGIMVNTNAWKKGLPSASRPYVEFFIEGDFENYNAIPVVVVKNGSQYELEANIGEPAEKICVNTWFQWTDEKEPIGSKYENFSAWVKDGSTKWY